MARFVGIPRLPDTGIPEWQVRVMDPLIQNVELLAGLRGEPDEASRAVLRGDVSRVALRSQPIRGATARGAGVTVGGTAVPTLEDYLRLLNDHTALLREVSAIRETLDALLQQMR